MGFFTYVQNNWQEIISLTLTHIQLTIFSVAIAILIGVPLGILISYIRPLSKPVLGISSVVQAIPSLALLGFLIPVLGIGSTPSIVMVVLYSLLPIIKNTATGLSNIDADLIEAGTGIGLTKFQILYKVKIPLSLPIIMAGVRISAVTAVGLVTIAAYIGAGGLGYLVYAGIRTVNNAQILAGAIPACLLALGMDFIFAQVEKSVSPISMRSDIKSLDKEKIISIRRKQKIGLSISSIVLILVILASIIPSLGGGSKTIVIGGKDFTEQNIIANIYAELIEDRTDINVTKKLDLGGTQVIFSAVESGDVDFYVDYTGTIYASMLQQTESKTPDETYDFVKNKLETDYNLTAMDPIGFNNTYTLAVRQETAEKYNLKTYSDLAEVSNELIITPTIEIMNRPDGLPNLLTLYNMNFKETSAMEGSLRYTAIENGQSDVIDAFSTDGLLIQFDLFVLEDDKNYFPPYYAFPIIRPDTLEEYPELEEVINLLNGRIDDDKMRELNYYVDVEKQNPQDVAHNFLVEEGLVAA